MNQTSSKLKLDSKNKSYSLTDSPFYKLKTKKKLAQLLDVDMSQLTEMANSDAGYRIFTHFGKKGKPREIQTPHGLRERLHTRIASLLVRIKQPEYLHSGIKSKTHITNASAHLGDNEVFKLDIEAFFASTDHEKVFDFFKRKLKSSSDVAELLAGISCCNGMIPTGSRLSMPLAYWSNSWMFDELNCLAESRALRMTVFVDDITFSGVKINRSYRTSAISIINKYGHSVKSEKTSYYKTSQVKIVTGVAINGHLMLVPNKHHKNIYQDKILLSGLNSFTDENLVAVENSIQNRILGRLNAFGQINPLFKERAKTLRYQFKREKI